MKKAMPKKAPIKTKIKEITKGKRVPRKGQSGPNGEESQYFHTGPKYNNPGMAMNNSERK